MKTLCVLFVICPMLAFSQESSELPKEQVKEASKLFGLDFTEDEVNLMMQGDIWDATDYREIRKHAFPNDLSPSIYFDPRPQGFTVPAGSTSIQLSPPKDIEVPSDIEQLAFCSVRDLSEMIRNRKITSTALTKMYLNRLKRYGDRLECVVTLTEDLALQQAARADAEIAAGTYRGPLHGVPYGIKDLFALPNYKTTWGAAPFKDQIIDTTAAVIERLDEAGAVLVAKLTLGALAMGDVWFDGKTRNPWKLDEGSSGSSAGPAAAMSAGLVAFAIGTETNGSIVSPCIRCGVTGLRPTFGRVSRAGAMTLSWSMDKAGPICRTAEDCAIVFQAIAGSDGKDRTVVDAPFHYRSRKDLQGIRIGYVKTKMDRDYSNKEYDWKTFAVLKELGADMKPVEFPDIEYSPLFVILSAEAAAAFDELTRSGRDDLLVQQNRYAWPNAFRKARLIPAVEYIQANRVRTWLIEETHRIMKDYDAVLAPPFNGNSLLLTNLTGHPCVVFPNGFEKDNTPVGITLIGKLYGDDMLLTIAHAYQEATDWHLKHPKMDWGSSPK